MLLNYTFHKDCLKPLHVVTLSKRPPISHEARAAKCRPFLKVVGLWVKSLPLVIKYHFARLPDEWGRNHSSIHSVDPYQKFKHKCAWMRLHYSKHSRQLQLSFTNLAQLVVGSLQHTCLSVAGTLFWLLSFFLFYLFIYLFFQFELPHKESECHHQSISAS